MSRKDTNRRAEYLMDEIGGIDESYLDEAIRYRGSTVREPLRTTTRRKPIRVLLAAASLVLVLAVGTVAVLTMLRRDEPDNGDFYTADGESKYLTELNRLDSLLQDCTQGDAFRPLAAGAEPDYFDGSVRLTVENRQTGERFVSRPLTDSEQRQVQAEFAASGTPVPTGTQTPDYLVWVLLGDGSVVTPCLNPSAGNVGAAVLFDYDPERLPSDIFTKLLTGMQ